MILERTLELILQIYKYRKILPPKVTKVVVGLGYTGVELSALAYSPFLGVAQTLPNIIHTTDCSKINFAGKLTENSYIELMKWSLGSPSLQKIIGIATLNAASQHILAIINPYDELKQNLVEYLKVNKNTRINFIGFFSPLIKQLMVITNHIIIVDNNILLQQYSNGLNIKKDVKELNKRDLDCDILFCSGTSLINDSLEDILAIFRDHAKFIIVLGPTVSFIPDVLFDYGVDIVGGMQIINSNAVLQIIQEGGGTKLFKRFGNKYNLVKANFSSR